MARVLIVGCGCRGAALARALVSDGHAVRGTSRDPARLAAIEAAGAEPLLADPDRLGTIVAGLGDVSVLCWLMGNADGSEALHVERLGSLVERLVDTPVRGLVYEAVGTVPAALLESSARLVERASVTWHVPVEGIGVDPRAHAAWLEAAESAVTRLLER